MFFKSNNGLAWAVFCLLNGFMTTVKADFNVSGWQENVLFPEISGLETLAKIDVGADYSSAHAIEIEYFEKNDQQWVRFNLLGQARLVKPLLKRVFIKPKIRTDKSESRPVVELLVCYGSQLQKVAFNLTDRSHLKTLLLIGRADIPKGWLVDPHQTQLIPPRCELD